MAQVSRTPPPFRVAPLLLLLAASRVLALADAPLDGSLGEPK